MHKGPLAGIRVLEFTQIIAGPFCCQHLADMGAEVIKFEPLEGEPWRVLVELVPKESRTFLSLNRGKKGIALDMTRPEGREIIYRLVPTADVVVINYRPGVAENLGIDYETLAALNPRLIYCENTAFGRQGPLAHRGGYDIVVQAMTGLMAGEAKVENDVPAYIYPAVADYATGIQMSNAVCAALFHRERTGEGQRIDCTLMGTALAMQTSQFTFIDAIDGATVPAMLEKLAQARAEMKSFQEQKTIQQGARPPAAGNIYYRVYQTADGFMAVGALSQSLRRKVLAATGLDDPRFKPDGTFEPMPAGWEERASTLVTEAECLMRSKTTEAWVERFEEHGVPAGPVYFVEELFDHPQTLANNLVLQMEHPLLGPFRMYGPPFQMSRSPLAAQGPSPALGADSDAVLAEAGYGDDEIAALRAAGVLL